MRFIINEDDINDLVGKFIVQMNTETPNLKLTDSKVDLEFYLVKRVRFLMYGGKGVMETDLFGNTHDYTKEKFVTVFNDYDFGNGEDLTKSKGKRFHRLLTGKELELVFKFLKERNY